MTAGVLLLSSDLAGGADDESVSTASSVLSADFDVEVARSSSPEDLDAALARCGGRLIVVAGGDGSLHAVVAALYRRGELADADLALVPLGTGNDFAQTLGIPVNVAAATAAVEGSVRRRLDLLVDDRGDVVVNVVHAGVGADAAARANALKPALGAAAYPLGAVIAAATTDGWELTVEADGVAVHDGSPVLMVAACNGRSVGGGTELCPLADPSDGLLDLVVVRAVSATARIGFGNDLRKGVHLDRDDVGHHRARTVTVRGTPVGYNSDGEISDPVASRVFSVLPSAWTLRVPAEAGDAAPAY